MHFCSVGAQAPPEVCLSLVLVAAAFVFPLLAMATPIVINRVQAAAAVASAGADLTFLLDRKQVDMQFQEKLYHLGVTSVELFAVFAKDQDEPEGLLKDHLQIDPKKLDTRVVAGRIIVAWMAARTRLTKQAELDGECEARKVPRTSGSRT